MAKVDVLTVDDVNIPRWRWWSCWIDVCLFDMNPDGGHANCHLLQMRVSRRNAKQFKAIKIPSYCRSEWAGDLTQMSRIKD